MVKETEQPSADYCLRAGKTVVRARLEGSVSALSIYSCFEKGCPTKPYATMPKGTMGNGGSLSLIEALGVSATQRETAQTNVFMPPLFLLVNTMNLNQSTPNSFYP